MLRCRNAAIILVLLLASSSLLSLLVQTTHADRCILPVKDVQVYGPGQKAIIAWNGETERLILSTDLYARIETKVLEVLPLPAQPTVEKASFDSFRAVQNLMIKNMPRMLATQIKAGLEVVFHEKIGSHDITIVKATSLTELANFMSDYLEKNGLGKDMAVSEDTRKILGDYLARDFRYWVFDLVDLYPAARSLEPLTYQFQSSSLYYPLKVSSVAKGNTEVILYLITSGPVKETDIPPKMRLGRYAPSDEAVQFQVSSQDLDSIDTQMKKLFTGQTWFTAVKYSGSLVDLDFDFQIVPRPEPCRRISARTDVNACQIGETLAIDVDFVHLLPTCVEITIVHFHEVRLEVLDSKGARIRTWQWITNGDLRQVVLWRPEIEGSYVVKASSWWNGEKLEVEAQTSVTVTGKTLPKEVLWLLSGVLIAVFCVLLGSAVTYFLLRPRLVKQS